MQKYSSTDALNLPEVQNIPTKEETKKIAAAEEKKKEEAKVVEAPPKPDIQTLMVNGVAMDVNLDSQNVQVSSKVSR